MPFIFGPLYNIGLFLFCGTVLIWRKSTMARSYFWGFLLVTLFFGIASGAIVVDRVTGAHVAHSIVVAAIKTLLFVGFLMGISRGAVDTLGWSRRWWVYGSVIGGVVILFGTFLSLIIKS